MQVIIMAAGKGSRMGSLTKSTHKSLLSINSHENFLSRLLHQINEYEVSKVAVTVGYMAEEIASEVGDYQFDYEIVRNDSYNEDINIWSMKLAMDVLSPHEPIIILEGDVYLDDLAMRDIFESALTGSSIWFTRGPFLTSQYGGILRTGTDNQIVDINIVPKYETRYEEYQKLLGITVVGPNEHVAFKQFLNDYALESKQQYWLVPWYENLKNLPCISQDLSEHLITSVNTEDEYRAFVEQIGVNKKCPYPVELINIDQLRPIEGIIIERSRELGDKIKKEGIWTRPLFVDQKDGLIMDGHHRYDVAIRLGLVRVPVIQLDYSDVPVWSLRAGIDVSPGLVREHVFAGKKFPCKTVKHNFKYTPPPCVYSVKDLCK